MVASGEARQDTGGSAFWPVGRVAAASLLGPGRPLVAALAVALLVALAIAAYLFRHTLGDAYSSAEERVLTAVGLGVVPLGLWILALAASPLAFPMRLSHLRHWAGGLVIAIASIAAMSAFETGYGSPIEAFTLEGEVSLGGAVAAEITRGSPWLAAVVSAALVGLAAGIIMPEQGRWAALRLGSVGWRAALASGSAAVAAASVVAGAFSSLLERVTAVWRDWRAERIARASARFDQIEDVSSITGAEQPSAGFAEYEYSNLGLATEPGGISDGAGDEEDGKLSTSAPPPHGIPREMPPSGVLDGEVTDAGVDHVSAGGARVNRFWSDAAEVQPLSAVQVATLEQDASIPAAEEPKPSAGEMPILDKWASAWSLPSLSMLVSAAVQGVTRDEMEETSRTIKGTLGDYGVEVEVKMTQPGPAVTMYGLEPGWVRRYKQESATDKDGKPITNDAGRAIRRRVETKTRVKVDTILQREKDLALALQTPSIRIESPVMGTSLVGIEVPNAVSELVTLRGVMESPEFGKLREKGPLPIALGKGSGGDTAVLDLAKLPHLLVAGATGSGKSVCLNTIVSCLTMEKSPSELRLLLVDPKRVELTPYNGIPHLLTPVVVETDKVVPLLKALIAEMFKRYRHLEHVGVRNIASYNANATEKMPYLVLVVDELADLMMTSSFDVEQSLCRLAQLGRATGIHLVIATQRPSVDVLTGLIKANFPSRIAFGVTSQVDSRTILDSSGAEKLLGRGDMLYQPIDASRPSRVQGVFISDDEVRKLVGYWQKTKWAPLPAVGLKVAEDGEGSEGTSGSAIGGDDLMDRAIELAHKQRKLSTSLLQRRLRIGYPRAARLMDELEEQGVVGPSDGSKSRDVIID